MDQHDKVTGREHETEYSGSIWTHPYMVYIWATVILFLILVFLGWLAWTNGWIPNRGISVN